MGSRHGNSLNNSGEKYNIPIRLGLQTISQVAGWQNTMGGAFPLLMASQGIMAAYF